MLRDAALWRWFLLTQLAAAAVLMNPYGLGLYLEVLSFAGNSNLQDLVEWDPLNIRMRQGQTAEPVGVSVDGQWYAIQFPGSPTGNGWLPAQSVIAENTENLPILQGPPPPDLSEEVLRTSFDRYKDANEKLFPNRNLEKYL